MIDPAKINHPEIQSEQIRLVFAQAKNVLFGGIGVCAVETLVLWDVTERFWLVLWVGATALISLIRWTFYILYTRKQPKDEALQSWLKVYLGIIFFVGLIWGGSGLLINVTPSYLHQSFIIIMLGGVAIGGISAHGSLLNAYLVFSLPLLLPLAIWQFSYGTTLHSGFGTTIILFTMVLFAAARNYNKAILSSLCLRRENLALAAKAEIASKAKSEFLANMSHEIRTPLTAIIGYAESSFDSNQTKEERLKALKAIKRSGDHLLRIVNDILDFSKIEANKLDVESVKIELFPLLMEIEGLMNHSAQKKGLKFHIDYTFPLPATFISDPVRVKQILLNLCSNAIKFTVQGEVVISIACERDTQRLRFRVRDTGIGMNEEQLEALFEPFRQADSSITRRFGGTGLGLSLTKRLVNLLGGEISIKSLFGKGTEFEVILPTGDLSTLPFINGITELDPADAKSTEQSRAQLAGSILLAEDNKENQELLSMFLRRMGADVETADNGELAVRMAQTRTYDLVYMDMQMPVMSGIDATKALRAHGYKGAIVALTANATKEDRELCLLAGCNDFLTKPVNRDKLYVVTARYLAVSEKVPEETAIRSTLLDEEPELVDLIQKFVRGLPDMLADIQRYYQRQDWAGFKQKVHDLKGLGGNFGYPDLSELAAKLEFQLLNNNADEVAHLFEEIVNLASRIYAGMFPAGEDGMPKALSA